jgi:hypothetical protein
VAAAASSEDTSLSSSLAGKSADKVVRSSREEPMDISLSLLQPQPKMERTAFRAWNHWTSLSPLFLPFALARLSSSVEPKAKMERNTDNTLVLDKGSKRTRTISLSPL